ncbi:hypothetical protein VHEMI00661 [[Torrubiella] hemipterigena]|uniref:Uncharacterized protein n=1 Tax=[Torrubiella] hemipterigena TaxID=1531966 RepID=A0A0A1T2K2_9HYPO|nr:hypothetical protein VHEMI00661 [[Torrubiella] hemipterigena]
MKWDNAAHEALLVAICNTMRVGSVEMKEIVAAMNEKHFPVTVRGVSQHILKLKKNRDAEFSTTATDTKVAKSKPKDKASGQKRAASKKRGNSYDDADLDDEEIQFKKELQSNTDPAEYDEKKSNKRAKLESDVDTEV